MLLAMLRRATGSMLTLYLGVAFAGRAESVEPLERQIGPNSPSGKGPRACEEDGDTIVCSGYTGAGGCFPGIGEPQYQLSDS